jgi:polyhydroxybutyrate depolymerase
MMTRRIGALLLALIVSTLLGSLQHTAAATLPNGIDTRTITVGAYQRTYHVHLPASYTGTTALPLVVALHGSYDSGAGMAGLTHFNTVADRFGVITAYPDALKGIWNSAGTAPQDDFAFIAAMIQQLRTTLRVDPHRIYAMGFSNGSVMTAELGCRQSATFAAIATVAGNLTSTFAATCAPSHPMPVIIMQGTADPLMSFNGWANAKLGQPFLGAIGAADKWAALAACTAAPATTNLPDVVATDGTTEQLRAPRTCAAGVQTQLYIINNGGHTWPGGFQYAPVAAVGRTSLDIDASTVIWQFFARFQH